MDLKNIKRPSYGTSFKAVQQEIQNTCQENYDNRTNQILRNNEDMLNDDKSLVDVQLSYEVDSFKPNKVLQNGNTGKKDGAAKRGDASDSGVTSIDTSNEGSDARDGSRLEASNNKRLLTNSSLSGATGGKSAYATVKETIRTFSRFYLQYVQEKQKIHKKEEDGIQGNSEDLKRKRESNSGEKHVKASMQLDIKALSKMYATNAIMYPRKRFGHLPGIDVGYQFHSRAEMVALGFHHDWLHDIDYMGKAYGEMEYKDYTFPLTVAIVLSVEDEHNELNSDDIIYTTLCGNNQTVKPLQLQNPTTRYGNHSLKNNLDQSIPIRIVRGHKSSSSYFHKVYTYDGLYKVIERWAHKDKSGCIAYKTRLRRVEGQLKLSMNQVYLDEKHSPSAPCTSPGLVSMDISSGQEEIPIPLVNLIDDSLFEPTGFTYSKHIKVAESVDLPPNADGCKCKGTCDKNPKRCACARLNRSKFPYVRYNGGRLTSARDVVFECGPNCGCGPDCINRISQRGIRYQLEVFRTTDKGWAVRTRDFIPSGAPVCEYVGVLRRTDELDNADDNEYIFEIDCLHTIKGVEGRERRLGAVSAPVRSYLKKIDDVYLEETPEFCIDANSIGSVSRFFNHSCEPNLFVQCVLSAHLDPKLARIFLFASEDIAPFQELTYDYGYPLDSVAGPDGKVKQKPCFCGATTCRKRLY